MRDRVANCVSSVCRLARKRRPAGLIGTGVGHPRRHRGRFCVLVPVGEVEVAVDLRAERDALPVSNAVGIFHDR